MKLHKGINQTEIAVRYYERKGKRISREQAQKNFNLLRRPDMKLLLEIMKEVYEEAISEMTYELEQKGIHPSLPSTIEKGIKGYSIDSLIKYLNAINETYSERGKKRKEKELIVQVFRTSQS